MCWILWILLYFSKSAIVLFLKTVSLIRLKLHTLFHLWWATLTSGSFLSWIPLYCLMALVVHILSSGFPRQKQRGYSIRVSATFLHCYNCDCPEGKAMTTGHSLPVISSRLQLPCAACFVHFPEPESVSFVCLLFSILFVFSPWIYSCCLQECRKLDITSLLLHRRSTALHHLILDDTHASYSKKQRNALKSWNALLPDIWIWLWLYFYKWTLNISS